MGFGEILNYINSAKEIVFDIIPLIDLIYLYKEIKNKKIVLVVNDKVDENIMYINLLRKNNLDVYIVQKDKFN